MASLCAALACSRVNVLPVNKSQKRCVASEMTSAPPSTSSPLANPSLHPPPRHAIMPAGSALIAPLRQLANYAPIVAALLAPASTMYDIPALSQKWYSLDGQELPDPLPSLVLSGFSLAASVIANSLLVLRFSVRVSKVRRGWLRLSRTRGPFTDCSAFMHQSWRLATRLSTLCWLVKTIIGMANLITFGALRRNGPGYAYLEGEQGGRMHGDTKLKPFDGRILVCHSVCRAGWPDQ